MSVRASVSTAVVQENKILLVQEASARKQGLWNLPSGRLNPGERFLDAAVREVREETGYSVQVLGVVGIYTYISASHRYVVRCVYRACPIGEASPLATHDEILDRRWWGFDALDALGDGHLWAPHILRSMLKDVRHGQLYPLDIVKTFE